MSVVDNALIIVGDDSIKNLYEFVEKRQSQATKTDNFVDWLMYTRMLLELSLAITSYTGSKESKDAKKSGIET